MSGLKVYNDKNEDIGSINDLLADRSGNIKAVVISVGGILGVGSRYVAIPYDKIKFVNEPVPSTGTADNSSGYQIDHDHGRCDGYSDRVKAESVVSGPRGLQCEQG